MSCIYHSQKTSSNNSIQRKKSLVQSDYNKIFTDKTLYNQFKYFLEKECSGNMIEFYEQVQLFKSLKDEKQLVIKSNEIYNVFLEENSQKEVPIKSSTRETIKNHLKLNLEKVDISIFDNALTEFRKELLLDPWTRFQSLNSKEVQELVDKGRFNHFKLSDVFVNDHLYHVFKNFLKNEYAEELLLYYESINNFKIKSTDPERFEYAKEIFRKFIAQEAQSEVNLKSETRESLCLMIQNVISKENTPIDLFDASFVELKQSLLIGIWSRFKTSESYTKLFE